MIRALTIPDSLQQIASPPEQLFGTDAALEKLLQRPRAAIVGNRKVSPYGQEATTTLAGKLERREVVTISGFDAATFHQIVTMSASPALSAASAPAGGHSPKRCCDIITRA